MKIIYIFEGPSVETARPTESYSDPKLVDVALEAIAHEQLRRVHPEAAAAGPELREWPHVRAIVAGGRSN